MGSSKLTGQTLANMRILLVVLPAFLMYGYNQSSLGGVLSFKSFTETFPRIDTVNVKGSQQADNARVQGTIVALYTLGCFFGSLGVTQLGNRLGRKKSLIVASTIVTIGAAIQASSTTLAQLIIGRLISGLGAGGVNVLVPIWQSECTKPENRGMNVVVLGVFIASGIAIAAWINFGLSFVEESAVSWRFPLAMPGFFSLLLIVFTPLFPESPRWLVSQARLAEARESLRTISGTIEGSTTAVEAQINKILQVERNVSSSHLGFIDFIKPNKERLFYRAFLAIMINFAAQLTGPAVISYYGTTLFRESLGLPGRQASLLNAGVLTWKIAAAVIPFMTIDRVGRKPLFMISAAGMALSMAGLAACVAHISSHTAVIVATLLVFLYMTFFPIGFLGANFLYSAEIATQNLRVYLSAIGTATHWLFNFVVAEITPIAFVTIGWRYYIVFAIIGAAVVPMVYFVFPETKGRSLEEMGDLFSLPKAWWEVPILARKVTIEPLQVFPVLEVDAKVGAVEYTENEVNLSQFAG